MKLSLCMIVRNSSADIVETLNCVKPYVDTWCIVDTGSEDNTMELIQETMKDMPGKLHQRKWVDDFGFSRTEALSLCEADYAFMIDNGDFLRGNPKKFFDGRNNWTADFFVVKILLDFEYARPQIFKLSSNWKYIGVLHEAAVSDKVPLYNGGFVPDCYIEAHASDKIRGSLSGNSEEKYKKDVEILENVLKTDKNNTRYIFYLAQSYMLTKEYQKAKDTYMKRARMGGFNDECYYSLLQSARCSLFLSQDDTEDLYQQAIWRMPDRGEAAYELAALLNLKEKHTDAELVCSKALNFIEDNDNHMFFNRFCHEWGIYYELAVALFCLNRLRESMKYFNKALLAKSLPGEKKELILKYKQKIESRTMKILIQESIYFKNIYDMIQRKLEKDGYMAKKITNIDEVLKDETYVVFGAHDFKQYPVLKQHYIIVQTEQFGNSWITGNYIQRLQDAFMVWDYSKYNVNRWLELNIKAEYVPHTIMEKDIDVLFVGTISPKRKTAQILLSKNFSRVVFLDGITNTEYSDLIRRSKVIMNIHYDNKYRILETARLAFIVERGGKILSERGIDKELENEWEKYLTFFNEGDYDDMIEKCKLLL